MTFCTEAFYVPEVTPLECNFYAGLYVREMLQIQDQTKTIKIVFKK